MFLGRLSDQNGEQQQNEDYGLSSNSQETIDDRSEPNSDGTDIINVTDNIARTPEHENFKFVKNTQNIKNNLNDGNSNENYQNPSNQNTDNHGFSSNSNWPHNQSGRSSESFTTADEFGEPQVFEDEATADDGLVFLKQYVSVAIQTLTS